jgi:signal transduction histidine kinase
MRAVPAVDTVTVVDPELALLPLPLTQRLSVRQWTALDMAVAALLAAAGIGGTLAGLDGAGRQSTAENVVRVGLVVAACVALPARRRFPRAVLAIIGASMVGLILVGSRGPSVLLAVLAMYTVASVSPPKASLWAAAVVTVGVLIASVAGAGAPSLVAPPLILVGWLAGENTRTRRAYIAGLTEWAAERDRQREERSRRSVADERLRIARELHDVVAHTMSVVAVRSSVARVVVDSQPEEARRALEIIEVVSRRAMHEMRLLVGVLRDGDATNDLAPAPGLAELSQLVTEVAAAGVAVEVHVDGQLRPLPAGVDVSAFRIVQEALTNVVRHARPAQARLDLRYRSDEIEIEVTDNGGGRRTVAHPPYPSLTGAVPSARPHGDSNGGPPARAPSPSMGSGHGLVGMRERVALFGGTFSSGPMATGYRVTAVLPTDDRRPPGP